VTPFEWTTRRLLRVAASFFVTLATEILKRQTPAMTFSEAVLFRMNGTHKKLAAHPSCLIAR
jgi:hypothetical protein